MIFPRSLFSIINNVMCISEFKVITKTTSFPRRRKSRALTILSIAGDLVARSLRLFFLGWFFLFHASLLHAADDSSPHHAQEIKVPLGCFWGDPPERLEELIHTGGLTLVSSETSPFSDKRVDTVRGVIGTALKQNLFIYQKNALVEIEYQYSNKNWSAKSYQDFFDTFRRMFDAKYGAGIQLINTTSPQPDQDGITTSIIGYQWTQASSVLELFYFTAEKKDQSYRLVSLHYKMP